MREMLENKLARFEELERALSDPSVLGDSSRMAGVAREHGSLARLATKYRSFKKVIQEIADVQEMVQSDDEEERELGLAELEELKSSREKLWEELLELTIGGEDANRSRCIMEIRAGTGGDEAAIFSGDLFKMYSRYAEGQNWNVEIMSENQGEHGGYKEIVARLVGQGAFSKLKFESGAHRVQRVPETESQGRVHTSACTVAIIPEIDEVEAIEINPKDLRIDTFRASGAGGQHVNKTDSAIRITHLPTGVVVECQEERSQHKNKAKAMSMLSSRLLAAEQEKQQSEQAADRKLQVGSGDRSERIRTYNYPQGLVTDHRINLTLYKI